MAVYKNDTPDWFSVALDSLLNQTAKSNDIVIVRDGPVPNRLEEAISSYESKYEGIRILRLEDNIGAGHARNKGVDLTHNELVAIMDADDISLPNRFELQLNKFNENPELSLVGGQISEFEGKDDNITGYRKVPTNYKDIKKFARYRSPINHVTIMFKKKDFLLIGGYPKMTRAEDYYMVSALLARGYDIENIDEVTVNCRVGKDNILRRKSWSNVRENIISRYKIYKLGTMSVFNLLISSLAQVAIYIIPFRLLGVLFNNTLRERT